MAAYAGQQLHRCAGLGPLVVPTIHGPKRPRRTLDDAQRGCQNDGFHVLRASAGVTSKSVPQPDRPVGFCIDEEKLIADMAFPIKPAELIEKSKYLLEGQRFAKDASLVDVDNFVFTGPVVGPLTHKQLQNALANFDVPAAFPILHECHYHFRVDPYIPGRVWFTSRNWAVNSGPLLGMEPTYKIADSPPQTSSYTFNKDGKLVEMTIGYVQDRRIGNQGGLGGIFGMLYAVGRGLPFREAQPWKTSFRYKLFQTLPRFTQMISKLFSRGK